MNQALPVPESPAASPAGPPADSPAPPEAAPESVSRTKLIALALLMAFNLLWPLVRPAPPKPRAPLPGPRGAGAASRTALHALRLDAWREARARGSNTYTFVTTHGPPHADVGQKLQEEVAP